MKFLKRVEFWVGAFIGSLATMIIGEASRNVAVSPVVGYMAIMALTVWILYFISKREEKKGRVKP